jgi:hypothetical protein
MFDIIHILYVDRFFLIVALRFAMTHLQTVFSGLTSITRYYPQVSRIYDFLDCSRSEDVLVHQTDGKYILEFRMSQIRMPSERFVMENGTRLSLVLDVDLNRYTIPSVLQSMINDRVAYQYALKHTCYSTNKCEF